MSARFGSFNLIFLVSISILLNGLILETTSISNPNEQNPNPAPSPTAQPKTPFEEFIDQCVKIMTEECANEITNAVFEGKTVCKECCTKLVYMGIDCHREMIKAVLELPEYKKENVSFVLSRSERVFNHCAATVKIPVEEGKKVPKVPPREDLAGYFREFLEKCAKKIPEECAREIVYGILDDKKITPHCCVNFVNMGEECQEIFLWDLKQMEEYKNNPKLIESRINKIRYKCPIL